MKKDAKTGAIASTLSQCPKCDYEDGFHSAFKTREYDKTEVVFICPSCHSRFDTGWIIGLNN